MKNILFHSFINRRVYGVLALVAVLVLLSYGIDFLFMPAILLLVFLFTCLALDAFLLFRIHEPITGQRKVNERWSNGDKNKVVITLASRFTFDVQLTIIDEVPDQFQLRDFSLQTQLSPDEEREIEYSLRPQQRGIHQFNNINVMVSSPLKLVRRRIVLPAAQAVKVMPSFTLLKKYSLMAMETNLAESGSRKMRKTGHSLEFEQIREYVTGDDVRGINWTATARKGGQLMVNSFVDERSQQVYCIIDKSRVMKMPFEGMTLLDYAINATLVLSQVALIKHDKAGLITFDERIGDFLLADRKGMQMSLLMDTLYNQKTNFQEADFEQLQVLVRTRITQRSLVILFTNFESMAGLERQLPYIRNLAKYHLVLVVFFENTGLADIVQETAESIEQLYIKTIAEKFIMEKKQMVKELYKYGILSLLTAPKQVTVNTVNKYLELKSRQVI